MNRKNKKILIIGVAGASGSGKSYFASKLKSELNQHVLLISQDSYYKQQSTVPPAQRELLNYDHPDAIDFELLTEHIKKLKSGQSVNQPVYDFAIHDRKKESLKKESTGIIILDGTLLYIVPSLNEMINYKIFVETPLDICFIRRLQRDMIERGRSAESVINQYMTTVRPMYLEYVLPSKQHADYIINSEQNLHCHLNNILDILHRKGYHV
ncbi:uridine kinase [candidate division KSB1 bacterium]|nr:uridine kinase [candidate division KSB1 bacterium]